MTAREVVDLLLTDAVDPKRVFRQMRAGPRVPQQNEVEYDLEAEWEDSSSPEDSFDDPRDIAFVRQQIDADNVWGWCSTHVIAKWTDEEGTEWTGDDWLGGCSYKSREDFMRPGGYYDDMKVQAYNHLVASMKKDGFR